MVGSEYRAWCADVNTVEYRATLEVKRYLMRIVLFIFCGQVDPTVLWGGRGGGCSTTVAVPYAQYHSDSYEPRSRRLTLRVLCTWFLLLVSIATRAYALR